MPCARISRLAALAVAIIPFSIVGHANAQWISGGVPVCVAPGAQRGQCIVTDQSAGAIILWVDSRNGVDSDIYAQRITVSGAVAAGWPTNGLAVCTAPNDQVDIAAIPDGSGGVIAVWRDHRGGGTSWSALYAQRITASGTIAAGWPPNGVAVTPDSAASVTPTIVPDGAGGAIMSWLASGSTLYGGTYSIFAQRSSASGVLQWDAAGVRVVPSGVVKCFPKAAPDAVGGTFVLWNDARNTHFWSSGDVYMQRITASGAIAAGWPVNGLEPFVASGNQVASGLLPDGTGGVLVFKGSSTGGSSTYAQRITSAGAVAAGWPVNGVDVGLGTRDQGTAGQPYATDGTGGAFLVGASVYNVYLQHILSSGAISSGWPASGIAVTSLPGGYRDGACVAADGSGGVYVVWHDSRNDVDDIYAQRITASGAIAAGWPTDGLAVCTALSYQEWPSPVSLGTDGAIVAWRDFRNGADDDIYASRVTGSGGVADVEAPSAAHSGLRLLPPRPNPMTDGMAIRFGVPTDRATRIEVFDAAGRRLCILASGQVFSAGWHTLMWDGRDAHGQPVHAGIYHVRLQSGNESRSQRIVVLQ